MWYSFCKKGFPLHHCLFHSLYGIAMGLSSSMIGRPADLVQVLTGQGDEHCRTSWLWHSFFLLDQVRHMLLEELYMFSGNHLEALRLLFDARSTSDNEGGPSCMKPWSYIAPVLTTSDWTVDTFVGYLVDCNADAAVVIKNAGPLLYKMFTHYGSFPFKVGEEKRMTCATFLRSIYMMCCTKDRVFWRDFGTVGGEPVTSRHAINQVNQSEAADWAWLKFYKVAIEIDLIEAVLES